MAEGMRALKHHVTCMDEFQYTRLPDGVVMLTITHSNLVQKHVELKFDLHSTIYAVKGKIYRHNGTLPEFQKLLLKDFDGEPLYELSDDTKMLGYYSVESGMTIHVIDQDPHSMSKGGGFEDVSLVEKYRMTDEEYDNRKGTLRAWKKEQLAKDPNFKYAHPVLYGLKDGEIPLEEREDYIPPGIESVQGINVGSRCEIQPGGRRGSVMWVGEYDGQDKLPNKAKGYWVGVKFDEPMGKCDGSNRGKRYFQCGANFGAFVRADKVATGDFPEIDLMDELGSDSEEEI